MKKLLHKLTMGDCSRLLILEARRIMRAIEMLGQIDYIEQIGVPRHRLLVHLQSNGYLLALLVYVTASHLRKKLNWLCLMQLPGDKRDNIEIKKHRRERTNRTELPASYMGKSDAMQNQNLETSVISDLRGGLYRFRSRLHSPRTHRSILYGVTQKDTQCKIT